MVHPYLSKTFLRISVAALTSTTILYFVFVFSESLPNRMDNGFQRVWLIKDVDLEFSASVPGSLNKICGVTKHSIYFSTQDPRYLFVLDQALYKWDTIYFPINVNQQIRSAYSFSVDSPYVHFYANSVPAIVSAKIDSYLLTNLRISEMPSLFTRSDLISPTQAVVRIFDTKQYKQVFQRIDLKTGDILSEATVIGHHNYGGFETDGSLNYDSSSASIVFVQKYQNRFVVFDTMMVIRFMANTIDTFRENTAEMTKLRFGDRDRITPANARLVVNAGSYVDKGYIYVHSNLRADNESQLDFGNRVNFDVYRIADGLYVGSIAVRGIDGRRPRSFVIRGRIMFVLYKDIIAKYYIDKF